MTRPPSSNLSLMIPTRHPAEKSFGNTMRGIRICMQHPFVSLRPSPLKLRFVCTKLWRAVRESQGSADKRPASRDALDSAPGSQNRECLLTAPTTLYTALSPSGIQGRVAFRETCDPSWGQTKKWDARSRFDWLLFFSRTPIRFQKFDGYLSLDSKNASARRL